MGGKNYSFLILKIQNRGTCYGSIGRVEKVRMQGQGTGSLQLEERAGSYWIALYKKPSASETARKTTSAAVDALKENPEAAVGAALTAAGNAAVKSVAAALGADRSAMRRIQVFENDSAKEFSKTFSKYNNLEWSLVFEKELRDLTDCSRSRNTVSMNLGQEYRLTFLSEWSGENASREFFEKLEHIRKKNETARFVRRKNWALEANGLFTLKGWGKMPDWDFLYDDLKTPWYERRTAIEAVHISDGFTNIGENAFRDCENLTTVYIPNGVTSIGHAAFLRCESLTNIDIPNSETVIERSAFAGCYNLTSIHIPYGVTSIGSYAFSACESLTEIRIPNSVTKLDGDVFYTCKKLKRVYMPSRFDGPLFKFRYGISKDIVTFT